MKKHLHQIFRYYLFTSILLFVATKSIGQNNTVPILEKPVSLNVSNQPADKILAIISEQTGAIFSYSPEVINARGKINLHIHQKPTRYALNLIFNGSVTIKNRNKYIILKKTTEPTNLASQKTKTIEGYITETKTGQKLAEVTVYDKNLSASAITNQYGYFKLEIPVSGDSSALLIKKQGYTDTLLSSSGKNPNYVDIAIATNEKDTVSKEENSGRDVTKRSWFVRWLIPKNIRINTRNVKDTIFRKAQVSLVPFIGTNKLLTGSTVNNYSFNILGGYIREVRKLEIGGYLNIVRRDAGKCQLAGVGNIVGGTSRGYQGAGIFNYAKAVKGVQTAGISNASLSDVSIAQLAGIINVTGKTNHGLQLAGNVNYAGRSEGAQVAGILNVVYQDNKKLQLAGIGNIVAGSSDGIQIAGMVNASQKLGGMQIAGLLNVALDNSDSVNSKHILKTAQIASIGNLFGGDIHGVQVAGLFNSAQNVDGAQISSIWNRTNKLKGTQIAMINISDTCEGIPIGFFSYVKKGYHAIELSVDERFANLSYRTGVARFHNIFSFGISPLNSNGPVWSFGYGLGTTLGDVTRKAHVDIDLTSQHLYSFPIREPQNDLYRLYSGIDIKTGTKTSMAFGLTINALVNRTSDPDNKTFSSIAPYSLINADVKNGDNLKLWLGAKMGIRFW